MTRQTLQNGILEVITRQVVSGAFEPGQILRTEDLENEHEASRSVVREALKVLQSMGLIAVKRRIGITVLDPSEWNVFDPRIIRHRLEGPGRLAQLKSLTDLRMAVEPVAAYQAAVYASSDQADELLSLAALLRESGRPRDAEAYLRHDIAFHTLLLNASANEMFVALSEPVAAVLTGRVAHKLTPDDASLKSLELHQRTAESIQRGAAEEAENAMRSILTEVKTQVFPPPAGTRSRLESSQR